MNKADKKTCNSLVFEDEAKVVTFAAFTTDNVKDFPLDLGEVGTNKVVAPENATEAKQLASQAKKLKGQGVRVKTKEDAEKRIRNGRNVAKSRTAAKSGKAKSEGTTR